MDPVTDTLINFGGELKALGETADGYRVGGYLVVFNSQDASPYKDRFTKSTDFDIEDGDRTSIYYNHGLDSTLKRTRLGSGRLSIKDAGVWFEGEIQKRTDYLKDHVDRIGQGLSQTVSMKGKDFPMFGLSSGVPAHLVERVKDGDGHEIKSWPLRTDASITPTPAEPLTSCVSLKSLVDAEKQEKPPETKSFITVAGELDNEAIRETVKALGDGLGRWVIADAARTALSSLSTAAVSMVGMLLSPDYEEWDSATEKHVKLSQAERIERIRKVLSDFADVSFALAVPMANVIPTKSLTDLETCLPDGLSFADHSAKVLATVAEYKARCESLAETRCSEDRRWSAENFNRLNTFSAEVKALADEFAPKDVEAEAAQAELDEALYEAMLDESRRVLSDTAVAVN